MATARKSGASRPKPKTAKPGKPAARGAARPKAAKPAPKRPVAKPAAAVKTKPVVAKKPLSAKPKVVGKPAVPGRVIGKPAVPGKVLKDAKGRPIVAAKKPGGKPVIRVVSHGPVSQARPIGALPPEAVARAMKGHGPVASRTVKPTRPSRDSKSGGGVEGVSEKDFKEFEQRLMTERAKIMKDMGYLESNVLKVNQRDSAGDLSGYSFHMADVGTDAYEREKAFLFASSEGRLLMDIDDALRKLYRGEYGRCEICEQPIARARLEAMLAARLCLSCKEKQERETRGAS